MTADEIQALIENTVPPPTEEQVQAFESEIGASLPQDYREFLAHCNGGWAEMKIEHESAYIMSINGIRKGHKYSLSYCRRFIGDRIPKSLIWIMNDPGENLICLGVTGRIEAAFTYGTMRGSRTNIRGMEKSSRPETSS